MTGYDACFYCLGATSNGLSEAEYNRITYEFAMSAAQTLLKLNPQFTFVFISGMSSDSSEKGPVMWARIKGKTENAILRMPFKRAYAFRPGIIQPLHGIQSRTASYRLFYSLTGPLLTVLRKVMPKTIATSDQLSQAMIHVAKVGSPKKIWEQKDICSHVAR